MSPPGRHLAWIAGAVLACGSNESAPPDVPPDAHSSPDAPALSDATTPSDPLFCEGLDATWEVERLTNTSDGNVRSGPLFVRSDGRVDVVACLPVPSSRATFAYYLLSRSSEGTWSAPEAIGAEETEFNNCAMSLVAVGETVHAAWVSAPPPAPLQGDILYKTRSPAGVWSQWVNLTEKLPDFMRMAQRPQLAVSADGAVSLLWVARDRPQWIFVARIEDGAILGEPSSVVVTDAADARCSLEDGSMFDADGNLHAIATCVREDEYEDWTPAGEHWLSDASGPWTSERVNATGTFGRIDVGPGGTVHVTWLDNWSCPGEERCVDPDVYYAQRDTEWRDAVLVGPSVYARPSVGVSDRAGVLVAFLVRASEKGGIREASLVASMDGAFSPLCTVPSPPGDTGFFVHFAMEIAPDTELPVMTGMYPPEPGGMDIGFAGLQDR